MKKFHIALVGLLFGLFATSGFAQGKPEFNVTSSRAANTLKIQLTETVAAANNCSLTVTRFEYFEDLGLINVETKPSSYCPLDFIGVRTAIVTWELPYSLRKAGAATLRVNGTVYSQVNWSGN